MGTETIALTIAATVRVALGSNSTSATAMGNSRPRHHLQQQKYLEGWSQVIVAQESNFMCESVWTDHHRRKADALAMTTTAVCHTKGPALALFLQGVSDYPGSTAMCIL